MKEALKRILPTAGIIALLAVLMAAVLIWMGRMEIITLPDFVMRVFSGQSPTEPTYSVRDDGVIYEALENRPSDGLEIVLPDIKAEDALAMIRDIDNPSGLYIENTVTLYAGEAAKVTENRISLDAEKYRVVTDSGISVICDGSNVSYSDADKSYRYSADRHSVYDFAAMPDINAVMDILSSKTAHAELQRNSEDNYLYVEFVIDSLKQTEKYYVSLDYGVVVSAESYYGDKLVYSLTTQSIFNTSYQPSDFIITRQALQVRQDLQNH
ncbi:MAG: hypothetical protein AB9835_07180 [Eubacteriales bacterium]